MVPSWFEETPLNDINEWQFNIELSLWRHRDFKNVQFYRAVRPLDHIIYVDSFFRDVTPDHIIWLDSVSFISLRQLPDNVEQILGAEIPFSYVPYPTFWIYGLTGEITGRAAAQLLGSIGNREGKAVSVGQWHVPRLLPEVPLGFITEESLRRYVITNPDSTLVLGGYCRLSDEESRAIATNPTPMKWKLACLFVDGGLLFGTLLSQRTDYFGVIIWERPITADRIMGMLTGFGNGTLPSVMRSLQCVSLQTDSCVIGSKHLPTLFSSNLSKLTYTIKTTTGFDTIEPFVIVPTLVTIRFKNSIPENFHTLFLRGSGNLVEMGVVYTDNNIPTVEQQKELLHAISTSKTLTSVEIGDITVLERFWEPLFQCLKHSGLRNVIMAAKEPPVRPCMVIRSLQATKSPRIAIWFCYHGHYPPSSFTDMIRQTKMTRSLQKLETAVRRITMQETLTNWTYGQYGLSAFQRAAIAMTDNTDVLCDLILDINNELVQQQTDPGIAGPANTESFQVGGLSSSNRKGASRKRRFVLV